MKRKNEIVPGFDDIIFENRNKEYGAYDLRKHYDATECISILGGVFLFAALVFGLTFTIENEGTAKSDHVFVVVKLDPFNSELNKIKIEEPPRPEPVINQSRYQVPEVVEDSNAVSNTFAAVDAIIDSAKNGNVNDTLVVVYNQDPIMSPDPEPAIWVEEMPAFPGGDEALLKYIAEKIRYPEEAASNGIQGRVILRFAVTSDGSVKRVEVLRGVHQVLDQEAIRVVTEMPKWKPGKQNGIAVPVWFSVPVNFQLKYN
jgi:periplasmic protein TonB